MRRVLAVVAGMATAVALVVAGPPAQAIDNVSTVALAGQPNGVVYSPDGKTSYVAHIGGLSVISTVTNTITATVPIAGSAAGVALTPDGGRAYVAVASTNSVVVVNTATNTIVATIAVPNSPYAVAVTPDAQTVLVTRRATDKVSAISTQTNTITGEVTVGNEPTDVAISADGNRAVVANYSSNSATVLSLPALTVAATVPLGANPYGVAMDPMGSTAYITGFGANRVYVLGGGNTVTSEIPVPSGPVASALSRDGKTLYVTEYLAGKIAAVTLSNGTISGESAVGINPIDVAVGPEGARLSVTNYFGGTMSVFSAAPVTETGPATDVKGETATGHAIVRADPNAVTSVRCYYGDNATEVRKGPRGTADSVAAQPGAVAANGTQTVICPFDGLTRGTVYKYLVAATDSDGSGWPVETQEFTTRPPKPAKPTITRKKTSLKFTWTPTRTATSYQGRIHKKSGWKDWKTKSSPKVKFSNLKRHTSYDVQLRAGNESGYGPKREVTATTK